MTAVASAVKRIVRICAPALVLVALAVSCRSAPRAAVQSPLPALPDSLRGTLSRVGNEPGSVLVLTPARSSGGESGHPVELGGGQLRLLESVVGLEVMVEGRLTDDRSPAASPAGARVFEVAQFVVRAAEGVPALDGTLARTGGRDELVLRDGRRLQIERLPVLLRDQISARVFLAGPLSDAPASYGIISARSP